jgi:hypothetical protein
VKKSRIANNFGKYPAGILIVMQKKEMKISISNPLIRDAVYIAYRGKCFFTGRPITREEMVIDHLMPVSKNGKDCFENYVLTFKDLNIGKSNKIDQERIEFMKFAVEFVFAPRVKKIYEELNKIKLSKKQRKPKGLITVRRKDLFWADDKGIEILTDSPLVDEKNIYFVLKSLDKFVEIARNNESDFCFDVWLTSEESKKLKSIWYQVGGKYFRLVKKTKYYETNSPDKWAYLYFTQEYLDFLIWKDKESDALDEIWELENKDEYKEKLKEYCAKYPPPERYRDEILGQFKA